MATLKDSREATSETLAAVSRLGVLSGAGVFVVALGVLHVLRSDLHPVERMMSEYAVGDYGVLMTLAFLAMAVACASLVLGLTQTVPRPALSVAGLVLLGVWALVMVLFAIFPIGVGETVDSTSDVIHRSAAPIGFFGVTAGVFLVSRRFGEDASWGSLSLAGSIIAVVMLVASISFFVSYAAEASVEGLAQRLLIIAFLGWSITVALRLNSMTDLDKLDPDDARESA